MSEPFIRQQFCYDLPISLVHHASWRIKTYSEVCDVGPHDKNDPLHRATGWPNAGHLDQSPKSEPRQGFIDRSYTRKAGSWYG